MAGVVELDNLSGWDEFASRHPGSAVYHLAGWREVLARAYGVRTFYLSVRVRSAVRGILPLAEVGGPILGRQLVSLPYHMYGGLIAEDRESEAALLEEAVALGRRTGVKWIELRNLHPVDASWGVRNDKVSLVLPLPDDPEALWKDLSAKVRNQCRKGEKAGLEYEADPPDALDAFYEIMVVNMRRLGSPVHARGFFAAARDRFPAASRIHVVRSGGRPAAAGFTITFKEKVEVPWASSLWEFNEVCANMFLYWSMLRDSILRGVREFDFGRSTRDSGTHRFKKQWGGREVPLHYQYWTPAQDGKTPEGTQGRAYQLAARVWRRLPLPVTRVLGPHIVRRIP